MERTELDLVDVRATEARGATVTDQPSPCPDEHVGSDEVLTSMDDLQQLTQQYRQAGKILVHCHGLFDSLDIGRIRHLQKARSMGDVLIVTITPDRARSNGSGTVVPEQLRKESVAALSCVDHVALASDASGLDAVRRIKPDVFVVGKVPQSFTAEEKRQFDDLRRILKNESAKLVLTNANGQLNPDTIADRQISLFSSEAIEFMDRLRTEHTLDEILSYLQHIRQMKILVIGEIIIDEYQFCKTMNKANKDPILAARVEHTERYAGGIMAIANHLNNFCDDVGMLSFLGETISHEAFLDSKLGGNVTPYLFRKTQSPTIVKRRFLESYMNVKLFETYEINDTPVTGADEDALMNQLDKLLPKYDMVIVADYGHGLMTRKAIHYLTTNSKYLAVNAQTNAGNRGFNFVSKYPRANFVSIDEPEARLEMRDQATDIPQLIEQMADKMDTSVFVVTRGQQGTISYTRDFGLFTTPILSVKIVDRMGAGDAFLSISAPCAYQQAPQDVLGFIGNIAGAIACSTIGNKGSITYEAMENYISCLMR